MIKKLCVTNSKRVCSQAHKIEIYSIRRALCHILIGFRFTSWRYLKFALSRDLVTTVLLSLLYIDEEIVTQQVAELRFRLVCVYTTAPLDYSFFGESITEKLQLFFIIPVIIKVGTRHFQNSVLFPEFLSQTTMLGTSSPLKSS